ncbi:MAG: periplasmic heavy metal sensor [Sulfitobacter sp.]
MTQTPLPKRTRGRALKWAFGISLALNLVFVGVFAGAAFRHADDRRGWDRKSESARSSGAPFVRALSQDDRRALRRAMRETAGDLPSRAQRRELHQQMIEILRVEPFDVTEVKRLFAVQTEAAEQVSGRVQTAWLERVGAMTAGERAAVADRLEEMLKRRKRKGVTRP